METLERFLGLLKPIKSVFSLYLLIYALGMFIPIRFAMSLQDSAIANGVLNVPVVIAIGVSSLVSFIWSIFFLIYFTNQRNNNPELYEKGFMSELNISGGNNE